MIKKQLKKTPSDAQTNKLKANLEAGLPIAGMVGYVPFDTDKTVYIKVKILKINTANCGIQITVEPVSGAGTMNIAPCQWVDTPRDIEEIKDQMVRTANAESQLRTINQTSYARVRKRRLSAYVDSNCTEQQKTDFYDQVEEITQSRSVNALTDCKVRWLAKVVCYQVNGVKEVVVEESRYGY
jgi:hypothetical protein